jgi:hypothetical protein
MKHRFGTARPHGGIRLCRASAAFRRNHPFRWRAHNLDARRRSTPRQRPIRLFHASALAATAAARNSLAAATLALAGALGSAAISRNTSSGSSLLRSTPVSALRDASARLGIEQIAVSSLGGFRTSPLGRGHRQSLDRHPKTFTKAVISGVAARDGDGHRTNSKARQKLPPWLS